MAWYSEKATRHVKSASRWRLTLVLVEGLGVVAALLKASGIVSVDLPGILAAILGAGSAWLAVRQHESLGRAYTFAANDLSIVHTRLRSAVNETAWAREVADAEEAISREHTMWRASRGSM
ncbi:SLATT domain-containing protein [Streptomyces sp. TRM70350]|uniref:SLATT domain-containing protein n=1 Tax=Streptomyces sp. TRM70350 TaxID=2856165 RepID=UPI0027E1B9C6|nr:SLATT domain-containing protein [Streptomyces sp. TRM70350]